MKTSPEPVAPIKKIDSELLTITEPEVGFFRPRGCSTLGEGFLCGELCFLDRELRNGAADRANADNWEFPMATAIPMTNCVMLLEHDRLHPRMRWYPKIKSRASLKGCDGHHKACEIGQLSCHDLVELSVASIFSKGWGPTWPVGETIGTQAVNTTGA